MPNYFLEYHPFKREGSTYMGITIRLPSRFPIFARTLKIDKENFEEYSHDVLKLHNFPPSSFFRKGEMVGWENDDNGLLHHARVPGNAAGIALHLYGLDAPFYACDNVCSSSQISVCLAVMIHYLDIVRTSWNYRKSSLK